MNRALMIVGVGGQGTLLASRILGTVLQSSGRRVKLSEVHGMSQRGGSVVTYIKYGDEVYSPVVEKGQADIIISFELLEAARWMSYLKEDGEIITSTQRISPMPVITGAQSYPENIEEKIRAAGVKLTAVDALSAAVRAGSSRAVNVVLMGVLSVLHGDFPEDLWEKAVEQCVPPKALEVNLRAFALGRELARS